MAVGAPGRCAGGGQPRCPAPLVLRPASSDGSGAPWTRPPSAGGGPGGVPFLVVSFRQAGGRLL
eukprot:4820892-Lingulodinium_polyedra.AAC.1